MIVNRKLFGSFVAVLVAFAVTLLATSVALAEDDQFPLRETGGISVKGISFLDGGRMMISFDMGPDFAGGDFHALVAVDHNKDFKCLTLEEYPKRLYCIGLRVQEGMIAKIQLVNSDTGAILFETMHGTPFRPTPEPSQPECKIALPSRYGEEITYFYLPCECEREQTETVSVGGEGAEPFTCEWWWNEYHNWLHPEGLKVNLNSEF